MSETPSLPKPRFPAWKYRGWLLWCSDCALIVSAVMAAYVLRFKVHLAVYPRPVGFGDLGAYAYLKAALLLAGVWTGMLWREGGYASILGTWNERLAELRTLLFCAAVALGACMAFSFAFRGEAFALSRQVMLLGTAAAAALCCLARFAFRRFDRFLAARGSHAPRVAVVGAVDEGLLASLRASGVRPCGRLRWEDEGGREVAGTLPLLGGVERMEEVHRRENLDAVLLGPDAPGRQAPAALRSLIRLLNFCEGSGIPVYACMEAFGVLVAQQEVGALAGVPLVRLQDACLHPFYGVCKRALDVAVALAVLVLGSPLWLFVALLVKLDSPGPVLYAQMRVGLHGRPFRMYKFRSMVQGAHERLREMVDFDNLAEPVYNIRRDPRVTRVGRWLRRTSLDEIPQLINVLKGEMSLVGPRPEVVELVEKYDPVQARRLKARPGITGYQQVESRGEPSLARRVELDLFYLKHQGFLLDLLILLRTVVVVVRGDGLR